MGSWSGVAAGEGRFQLNSTQLKLTSRHGRRRKARGDPEAGRNCHQTCRLGPDGMGGIPVHAVEPRHWRDPDQDPLSWLKITVFYCIYYCFLAGFWIACLNVFFATLPEAHDGPRWLKEDSIIGVNPGVGLRPRNTDARIDSQMF